MNLCNQSARFSSVLAVWLFAGAAIFLPANLHAAEPSEIQQKSSVAQKLFASPDEAVKALQAAAAAKDTAGLHDLFGPEFKELLTGDAVQDANNVQGFAAALAQGCNLVTEGDDKVTFELGTNNWPMPIPLVKADGQWHFDTAAGKEEVINRHVGKDELHAIGVCRDYVEAQKKYGSANPGTDGKPNYAQKFKSAPGKKEASIGHPLRTSRPARSDLWWPKLTPRDMSITKARGRIPFTVTISEY